VGAREMTLVLDGELSLDAARERAKLAVVMGEANGVVTVTDGTRILYQCWGDGADFYELQYELEEARRRSPRLALPIPVELVWGDGPHGARTADVSYHGAKVLCTSMCPPDTPVEVKNLESGARAHFRVVWIADHEADVSWAFKLGLEFTDDLSPDFWGADYQRQARES